MRRLLPYRSDPRLLLRARLPGCGAGGDPGTRPPRPGSSRRARPCALIAPQPAPRGRAERRGPRRPLPPPDPPRPRGGGGHCRVPEKFVGPESSLPRPRALQLLRGARRGRESCLKSVTEGGGEKRGESVGRRAGGPAGLQQPQRRRDADWQRVGRSRLPDRRVSQPQGTAGWG